MRRILQKMRTIFKRFTASNMAVEKPPYQIAKVREDRNRKHSHRRLKKTRRTVAWQKLMYR